MEFFQDNFYSTISNDADDSYRENLFNNNTNSKIYYNDLRKK